MRASFDELYFNDDWRVRPGFSINAGLRREYSAPFTELHGRLVNLDVLPGFAAEVPVVAYDPTGPLTGQHYADSLLNPDHRGIEPRIAIAWHPIAASPLTIRAGYGIYFNTSIYQNIAHQMYQQAPLSKSLIVANSAADPLTLANGFNASPNIATDSFGIDPNFKPGYVHNWQRWCSAICPGAWWAYLPITASKARTRRRYSCLTPIRWAPSTHARRARPDITT